MKGEQLKKDFTDATCALRVASILSLGREAVDRIQVLEAMLAKAASHLEDAAVLIVDLGSLSCDEDDLETEVAFIAEIRALIGDETAPREELVHKDDEEVAASAEPDDE